MVNYTSREGGQWQLLVLLLKNIAQVKGISHKEIADRAGLQKSNVTRTLNLRYIPTLETFLKIANAVEVNFFVEDQDSTTDLNLLFEKAMEQLGRRPDKLPSN